MREKVRGGIFSKYLVLFSVLGSKIRQYRLCSTYHLAHVLAPPPAHVVGADSVMVGRAASVWKISIIFLHFGLLSRFKKHNSGRCRVCAPSQINVLACHPLFFKIRCFFNQNKKCFYSEFNMAPASQSWSHLFDPSCSI